MLLTLLSPQLAPGSIVGSVNVTEAPDTLTAGGWQSAFGFVASTEAADTLIGVIVITGWGNPTDTPESWNPTTDSGATWSPVSGAGGNWSSPTGSPGIWTPVPGNSETWS